VNGVAGCCESAPLTTTWPVAVFMDCISTDTVDGAPNNCRLKSNCPPAAKTGIAARKNVNTGFFKLNPFILLPPE
jgi:hypothetical protein